VTDHISGNNPFTGSTKVTCREAAWLLNGGAVDKAWFRPDEFIDHHNPDQDVAFVWYKEGAVINAMPQTDNTEPQAT
jgi:hypothetical protein